VCFAAQELKTAHKVPVFPDRNRKEGENKWRGNKAIRHGMFIMEINFWIA
jgi:hypothetical protein